MLSDQIFDLVGLVGLQKKLAADISATQIFTILLALGIVAIAVDYARMLWLRAKMVRALP